MKNELVYSLKTRSVLKCRAMRPHFSKKLDCCMSWKVSTHAEAPVIGYRCHMCHMTKRQNVPVSIMSLEFALVCLRMEAGGLGGGG